MKKILFLVVILYGYLLQGQNPAELVNFSTFPEQFDGTVYSIKNANNKFYIGGGFSKYRGVSNDGLVRLNSDGTIDPSFKIKFDITANTTTVYVIAIQSDGKILIGGNFNIGSKKNFVRLNTDGSLDENFMAGSPSDTVYTIVLQNDGKILVGGSFSNFGGIQNRLIRLNADGTKDTSFDIGSGFSSGFNGKINDIALQNDGKIIVAGNYTTYQANSGYFVRLNSDGSRDNNFLVDLNVRNVKSISLQFDQKIIIGGDFNKKIIRLNPDGSDDNSFDAGFDSSSNFSVNVVHALNDGNIIAGGESLSPNNLLMLDSKGSKVPSFDIGSGFGFSLSSVNAISVYENIFEKIFLVGGEFKNYKNIKITNLVNIDFNGKRVPFYLGSLFNNTINQIILQDDGKILAVGAFTKFKGNPQDNLIRVNPDLTLTKDNTFVTGFDFVNPINPNFTSEYLYSVAVDNNQKIIVGGGTFFKYQGNDKIRPVIRLNQDGMLDSTFATEGENIPPIVRGAAIRKIAFQSENKILLGGVFDYSDKYNILGRVNSKGEVDNNFNSFFDDSNTPDDPTDDFIRPHVNTATSGGSGGIFDIVQLSNGKILIGGNFIYTKNANNDEVNSTLMLLNDDGTRAIKIDQLRDLASPFLINENDVTGNFGDNIVKALAVGKDGNILVGGNFLYNYSTNSIDNKVNRKFMKIRADGSAFLINSNNTFHIEKFNGTVNAIVIQEDGKILVGGEFTTFDGQSQNHLIRLNSDGTKDTTFDIGTGFDDNVNTIVIEKNGQILVGGDFTVYNGIEGVERLARLKGDSAVLSNNNFEEEVDHVTAYPNPFNDKIYFSNPSKSIFEDISLFDISGKLIWNEKNTNTLNLASLAKGMYFTELILNGKKTKKKIIKE